MCLGNTLINYRKEKRLTQQQMANMLGVSQSAVGSVESDKTGKRVFSARTLILLSEITGIDAEKMISCDETFPDKNCGVLNDDVTLLDQSVKNQPLLPRRVPILSALQVKDFIYEVKRFNSEDSDSPSIQVFEDLHESSFAMVISDDLNEPILTKGSKIVVDPSMKPGPDKFALVVLAGMPVIGKYVQLAGKNYLSVQKPGYPPIEFEFKDLIGQVVLNTIDMR